jgi:hypothetical protein
VSFEEQVAELLAMAQSNDEADRLSAAENLCPCHVRTRIPAAWDAIYLMMEDSSPRVRQAAWHTIEDGGKPGDEVSVDLLERLCRDEKESRSFNYSGVSDCRQHETAPTTPCKAPPTPRGANR